MFEPNSIKSLLSKRKSARKPPIKQQQNTKDSNPAQNNIDPDYESINEVKLLKKDIQDRIESIQVWRKQQQEQIQEKFKSNKEAANKLNQAYLNNLEKQAQKYEQQLKSFLNQLDETKEIKINQNEEIYDTQKIFAVLTETNHYREKLKNQNLSIQKEQCYEELVTQMVQLSQIFQKQIKNEKQNATESKKIDNELLKKEMEEIENQLKDLQELLADQPTQKKQANNLNKK